jgi:leader peptidase (prepilin peptidase) / N-methyltransferase
MMINSVLFFMGFIVFALMIGSFLTMLTYRFPRMLFQRWQKDCQLFLSEHPETAETETLNLALPCSHCPCCKTPLRWYHNIPLIGFIIQHGRCKHCLSRIPRRYVLIELLAVLLPLACYTHFHLSIAFYASVLFSWCLIVQSFIDIEHQIIPDELTIPMIWIGLVLNMNGVFTDIHAAIIGAIVGYVSLWIFAKLFYLLRKKEGMGHGDFKLFAMLGAWMGWQQLPMILLMSSFLGAVIGLTLLYIRGQDKDTPFPFGPYLAISGWIALLIKNPFF